MIIVDKVCNGREMDMIEETTRTKNNHLDANEVNYESNETIDDGALYHIDSPMNELEEQKALSEVRNDKMKVSRLFVELLVCSLLLWSLLFIKQSHYEEQVTQTIKQVLNQNIQSEPLQEFVEKIETAVKQIF